MKSIGSNSPKSRSASLHGENIPERAQILLKTLVERYIRDGQPVGSKTLAEDTRLELSTATIRNVVADLERLGLVSAPHTSAGRIPTELGYRMFIDNLVSIKPLKSSEVKTLSDTFDQEVETSRLLESASNVLSGLTQMAGVVMMPYQKQVSLRQIEFLPLSDSRVLAILVCNECDVQNRVIYTSRPYTLAELERISSYLNQQFIGKDVSSVRRQLLKEMQGAQESMDKMMRSAIEMAQQALEDVEPHDYVMAGETNLMGYEEMADVSRLKQLFDAFNEKQGILDLLDKSLQARGVQIFIGQESGYEVLDGCSVITAPYSANDEILGVLGIIGPKRMAYDRIIPVVDVTAKMLGGVLNQRI